MKRVLLLIIFLLIVPSLSSADGTLSTSACSEYAGQLVDYYGWGALTGGTSSSPVLVTAGSNTVQLPNNGWWGRMVLRGRVESAGVNNGVFLISYFSDTGTDVILFVDSNIDPAFCKPVGYEYLPVVYALAGILCGSLVMYSIISAM